MSAPFIVHAFNGTAWHRLETEYALYASAAEAAVELSRGHDRAADIEQDGVKVASFRGGKRQ